MKIEKISYSRLELFNQCQYHYKLHYDDKVKSPLPEPEYFEFGHYIHKLAELVVRDNISIEEASKISYAEYNRFGKEHNNKIKKMIRNFIGFQKNIENSNPIKNEAEVEFDITENDFRINGYIDRVITYNNNNVLIVDYKTSKENNEIKQKDIHNSKQLMTYAWAYNKITNTPIENISAMLFYLDSGNKPITRFNSEKINNHIKETIKLGNIIKQMDPEKAKANVTKLCNWCEYRTICKYFLQSK